MGAWIAAFSCGVIILYSSLLAPPQALWLALAGIALGLSVRLRCRHRYVAEDWPILACFLVGLAWAALHAQWRLWDQLSPGLEGSRLKVTGYLCDAPSPGAWGSVRFSLCLTGELDAGLPRRLRLSWYGDKATLDLPTPMTAEVILKRPHGAVNPGGFRYETWLFRKGYGATGTVRSVVPADDTPCGLVCRYHRWRQQLVAASGDALAGMNHRGLARSLLLGYRGELGQQHWDVLNATGTIHLVAISGLHLGLVAGLTALVLRWLGARLPSRSGSASRLRYLLWGLTVVVALGYGMLAGFTVPTRRALVMVVIGGWLLLRGKLTNAWQGWLVALGLVLAADPLSPLDQGFWLSFAAVAVLVLVFSRRQGAVRPLRALVLAQLAVFAGLWPVLSLLDQAASPVGLIANLLAIPWLSLVVMPTLLLGGGILLVGPGSVEPWVGLAFDLVLAPLWWLLSLLATVQVSGGRQPFLIALAIAVVLLTVLWWPDRRLRAAAAAMLSAGLLAGFSGLQPANHRQDTPRIWVWDVGQGLSVLVHHRHETLLYDTGPESASGYNAVTEVLVPSLERVGVERLDTLVLSHGDRDHAGGLGHLFRHYSPARVISGEPGRVLADAGLPFSVAPCRGQPPLEIGDVRVRFWQAAPEQARDSNDRSCVVVIDHGGEQVILPGDISRPVERAFLEARHPTREGRVRGLTVFAPHHGSNTSSGKAWVSGLAPDRVIFTAGYRHRYGHPHPDVVQRYHEAGAELFNTATTGALRLDLAEGDIRITPWRDRAPFWIRPAEALDPMRSE
ncbi:competence protein ComEC [Marinobacter daqiaonensis]|uniref:Competence protein ComEC n=1 Tax=Marinobacter daqiaonensis TaxID=650891 RepID=A0A1I6H1P0_9GAMM|nr:DNA internalization-related competence protein ComEC/Rec2 [Marinobacter daqiaonensis]SFR48405.1 competence protein ComEC [Marinobacter daqiaonensis]